MCEIRNTNVGTPSYQSYYQRQKHASYFCKQKQHQGVHIDGFFDEYTFRQ